MSVLEVLLVVLMPAAIYVVQIAVSRALKERRAVAEARRRTEEWKVANPTLPALTDAQVETFKSWYGQQALPAVLLDIGAPVEPRLTGSHVGGAAMWPTSRPWPAGSDGQPLQFLAQLDFACLPHIPDFPEKGVLQFFIGGDDLYGADFENPRRGAFKVEWWPEGVIGGEKVTPPGTEEDYSPLSPALAQGSRALVGRAGSVYPSAWSLLVERHPDQVLRRENTQQLVEWMDKTGADVLGVHRIGGHPEFTQQDFRSGEGLQDYDRLLLQFWSTTDGLMMWGDMGQGNFMITRKDLLARDFSKVTFHWDCC